MADTTRMDAIHSLVEQLKCSYPQKGFLIDPSVTYVQNDKGICVIAKNAIKLNDILLVIPESARMATKNIPPTFDNKKSIPLFNFDKLIKEVEKKLLHILQDPHDVPDHLLSFIVMYAISNYHQQQGNNNTSSSSSSAVFMKHGATMPSHIEMRNNNMNLYWTEEQLNVIGGTKCYIRKQIQSKKEKIQLAFNHAIYPILNTQPTHIQTLFISTSIKSECGADSKSIEERLRQTYLNAYAIVNSRSHGKEYTPELIPLIDQFNGESEWNPDGSAFTQ